MSCSAAEPAPTSIVLVTFDTLRRDHVGVYAEGAGHTPHLDAFAASALLHENAYTSMPTTAPAHASLFTGLHPHEHGILRNGQTVAPELAQTRSAPQRLREAGYATGAFVTSIVLGRQRMGLAGFDVFDWPGERLRPGPDAVRAALAWLGEQEEPVFLWLHLFDPHSPYGDPEAKRANFPVDPTRYDWVDRANYADEAERSRMAQAYARGVRDADAAFGELLAGLDLLAELDRLSRPPAVIVAADHGEFLDERLASDGFAYGHGSILDDASLRIPLLVRGPNVAPGRSTAAVSIRDLYTTLLGFAGLDDETSIGEGRRDLRQASSERRIVTASRRAFRAESLAPHARQTIANNVVAATDGSQLVVLGENAAPTQAHSASPPPDLAAAAGAHLERCNGVEPTLEGAPVEDDLSRRLEELGYVE